jgi:hypothetical protein
VQFVQIDSYHSTGNPASDTLVNQRIEYFHHCWNFVLREKSRWLLFSHEKLESHRSLFYKANLQLSENVERYPNRLRELISNHPYFSSQNIILRNDTTAQHLATTFRQNFATKLGTRVRDDQSKHLKAITSDVSKLERRILGKLTTAYLEKILNAFASVIHHVARLDARTKDDIQFLVNAVVIELYHFGYSPAFIRKVPDIILYPRQHLFDFPFQKSRRDFSSNEAFNAYTHSVLDSLTLRKQIMAILEFAKRPKLNGFYVFRINNFEFAEITPLEVWGVKFYNPQLSKQLCYREGNEFNEYAEEIEKYFEKYVKPEDREKLKSTCNAMIATEYQPLHSNYPDQSVYKAIERVNRSLSVLKNIKHLHVGGYSFTTSIDLKCVIITHEDGGYHAAPFVQHDYNDDKPFVLKERAKESVTDSLKWTNKLDPKNSFHKKMIDIAFAINRYRYDPITFSFSDFWINVCDGLFPNNPERFIDFACACVELYLTNQMMSNLKIFLHDSLKRTPFSAGYYFLTEKQMANIGLDIRMYQPIKAKKFSNRFVAIKKHQDFEFLNDLLEEAHIFTQTPEQYFVKIKSKLRSSIYEVYAERNLEVHNNLSTDLSALKLSEFCVSLAVIIRLVIAQRINTRTKSINDLGIV